MADYPGGEAAATGGGITTPEFFNYASNVELDWRAEDLTDSSGNGRDLQLVGGNEWRGRAFFSDKQAFYFNGSTELQFANAAHNTPLQLTGSMTLLMAYIMEQDSNYSTPAAGTAIVGMQGTEVDDANNRLYLAHQDAARPILRVNHQDTNQNYVGAVIEFFPTRNRIVVGYRRTTTATSDVSLWTKGGKILESLGAANAVDGSNGVLRIGRDAVGTYWRGWVQQIMIISESLSDADMQAQLARMDVFYPDA